MRIIEHEIKRYVVRVKEFKQKMEDCKEYNNEFNDEFSTSCLGLAKIWGDGSDYEERGKEVSFDD